jgi:hypothetical protein
MRRNARNVVAAELIEAALIQAAAAVGEGDVRRKVRMSARCGGAQR